MQGIFRGWLNGKPYGFIVPEDGSPNIFLHQSRVQNPNVLRAGTRIQFEVEETEKGRAALSVIVEQTIPQARQPHPNYPGVRVGRPKFWSDRGYGFIRPEDRGEDVFVHANELSADANGALCDGDVVGFRTAAGAKGPEAFAVTIIGWEKSSDHLSNFADLGRPGWLEKLKGLAEHEPWEYTNTQSTEPLPILRSYIRYTFRRVEEMKDGIGYSSDGEAAAFNTGLVTPNQEEIYAFFRRNPRTGRQPWLLAGFRKASEWDLVDKFGSSPPPLANYFEDPSVLLYDRRCELFINIDHVMENLDRFPQDLRSTPYVARQLLVSAEATTKKRVYRNYKTAIPQYYRDKGGDGSVQLLLPICLQNPAQADLALVVAKNEAGNAYRGSTVLTLDMAYNNARLLARPDTEWLQP